MTKVTILRTNKGTKILGTMQCSNGAYWDAEGCYKYCNSMDKLCKFGWVVIQSSFIGFAGDDAYHTPQLTREQKQWLKENESNMSYDQRIGLELCLEINEMLYEI